MSAADSGGAATATPIAGCDLLFCTGERVTTMRLVIPGDFPKLYGLCAEHRTKYLNEPKWTEVRWDNAALEFVPAEDADSDPTPPHGIARPSHDMLRRAGLL